MSKHSKVIFWNIWGHRHADEIHNFLHQQADADVFCLTEVTDLAGRELEKLNTVLCHSDRSDELATQVNGFAQLREHFGDTHILKYKSATRGKWTCKNNATIFRGVGFGSVLIVKNGLDIIDTGFEVLAFDDEKIHSRILQWVVYTKNGTCYLLAHLHGIWIKGNTKGDHAERDNQSLKLRVNLIRIAHMYGVDKIIFGGDFNLDINTNALRLMEGEHYRNLIREFGVTNTRTKAYRDNNKDGVSLYADYVLVSQNVNVRSFQVHNETLASDHAPLVVEFS